MDERGDNGWSERERSEAKDGGGDGGGKGNDQGQRYKGGDYGSGDYGGGSSDQRSPQGRRATAGEEMNLLANLMGKAVSKNEKAEDEDTGTGGRDMGAVIKLNFDGMVWEADDDKECEEKVDTVVLGLG